MGLTSGLLDAEALADAFELIINEGQPVSLLDLYANERQRVFQMFTNPITTQNKLRCAADPSLPPEDWFLKSLLAHDEETLKRYGAGFFETWRTDMKKLAISRGFTW